MPIILIVKRSGEIEELNVKSYNESELFKKAGFKSEEGFAHQTQWDVAIDGKKFIVNLYAKSKGRAGHENKYEFPAPVDQKLFFGNCVLVNSVNASGKDDETSISDLTRENWEFICEGLLGGFEDIGTEDSNEDEDVDRDDELPKTSTGYARDGFVVEDDSEEDVKPKKSKSTKSAKDKDASTKDASNDSKTSDKKSKKKDSRKKTKKTVFDTIETNAVENDVLTCTDELVEEEYL